MFPAGEFVTRQRGVASADPYSGESIDLDWTDPTELVLERCAVWPGASSEPVLDVRDMVVSDFHVAAPYGSDVTSADRLVIRGLTCEVVGRPFDWRSPFTGWQPARLIAANIVEG